MKIVTSATRYSTDDLVSAIRQVCERANLNDPTQVSQCEFDRARSELAIKCPRASDLSKRFGLPWHDLLEKANRDNHAFRTLRQAEKGYEPARVNRATCVAAVRLAADQLGQNTLLPREYEAQRNQAISDSRGSTRDRLEARWPVLSQIKGFGWSGMLRDAGLATPSANQPWAINEVDLMELFLECRGYAPTMKEATRFAKHHRIAVPQKYRGTKTVFGEMTARRTRQRKWTPSRTLIGRWAPDPTPETLAIEAQRVQPAQAAFRSRVRHHWTDDRILEGLDLAIAKLAPGESLTQVNLRELARENPGRIPAPSTVTKYAKRNGTTLPELREAAIARVGNR